MDGDRPGIEHVPRLECTERVIKEAMRLYPPVFIMFRRATEDAVVGGYQIPEGTILALPQFRLHADERFYDDPDAFRPDRWADDREADRPEYAYFPFGGGPRHCIGMRFATLEMKLVLATLSRRFELLSDPNPEVTAAATLQPKENVRVRLHERRDA
ncbi:cytochrome P450 [Halosolutus gelatinilyticus]|uniref:cytochrome P450 n=1 Tax=Halosolutus gelatinilyticus TaxID=2931975 RepID=UPI001FF5ADA8|nr:cytochrome P450 [Halosolutus gelatinilyticus]